MAGLAAAQDTGGNTITIFIYIDCLHWTMNVAIVYPTEGTTWKVGQHVNVVNIYEWDDRCYVFIIDIGDVYKRPLKKQSHLLKPYPSSLPMIDPSP